MDDASYQLTDVKSEKIQRRILFFVIDALNKSIMTNRILIYVKCTEYFIINIYLK